jgi:hypothetical protein
MAFGNRIRLVRRLIMNVRIFRQILFNAILAITFVVTLGTSALAQGGDDPSKKAYSPHAGSNYPNEVLFGDTHLHTALSMDGGMSGATLMPADGYRFAKGEEITSNTGLPVKLSRPLDFLVVADHVENLGFSVEFLQGKEAALASEESQRWNDLIKAGKVGEAVQDLVEVYASGNWPDSIAYEPMMSLRITKPGMPVISLYP